MSDPWVEAETIIRSYSHEDRLRLREWMLDLRLRRSLSTLAAPTLRGRGPRRKTCGDFTVLGRLLCVDPASNQIRLRALDELNQMDRLSLKELCLEARRARG